MLMFPASRPLRCSAATLAGLFFLQTACVPVSSRTHTDAALFQSVRQTALPPPMIEMYELSAGGVREKRDDWARVATTHFIEALREEAKTRSLPVTELTVDNELESELRDVQALYQVVSHSISLHAYEGPHAFPTKKDRFDYTIGPIDRLLDKTGSDTLLLVQGVDERATEGRKALMAAGLLVGVLSGVVVVPRGGGTGVDAALLDRSGRVLWHCRKGGASYDFQQKGSVMELVREMLETIPLNTGTN